VPWVRKSGSASLRGFDSSNRGPHFMWALILQLRLVTPVFQQNGLHAITSPCNSPPQEAMSMSCATDSSACACRMTPHDYSTHAQVHNSSTGLNSHVHTCTIPRRPERAVVTSNEYTSSETITPPAKPSRANSRRNRSDAPRWQASHTAGHAHGAACGPAPEDPVKRLQPSPCPSNGSVSLTPPACSLAAGLSKNDAPSSSSSATAGKEIAPLASCPSAGPQPWLIWSSSGAPALIVGDWMTPTPPAPFVRLAARDHSARPRARRRRRPREAVVARGAPSKPYIEMNHQLRPMLAAAAVIITAAGPAISFCAWRALSRHIPRSCREMGKLLLLR
jgi:hypothetical protein